MGGARRPGRRGILPSAFGRRGCDPTFLHHGRYCAHRRHGRSPHPSFQMSFAATLALVAGYQHGLPWMSGGGKTRLAAKIALWGGREIAGLLLVSLLAGAATIPFIAYHFHRISPYGVIANLV